MCSRTNMAAGSTPMWRPRARRMSPTRCWREAWRGHTTVAAATAGAARAGPRPARAPPPQRNSPRRARRIAAARSGARSLRHDDWRADRDQRIERLDVFVMHADAAVRHVAADRTGIVGAVDGELAILECQRRDAHRIFGRATGNNWRRAGLAPQYRGRRPGRREIFAFD